METIKIGKDESGNNISIDLDSLIDTRLLCCANSGGGKSYLLRKIIEECSGKIQQIILDLEGEFHTLREKYDFLLVGKDGDLNVDIRSAEILARELLRLNVSAIIDLYELKQHERIRFVKLFIDSMINAPKELWKPCLVYVDEAHIFSPEGKPSESTSSIIDLCTRGRKRGYTAILSTQRISKLSKDAAAELNNILIGRTGLDIDMKRSSELLGFTSKQDTLKLRDLNPGEFYSFGPSISTKVMSLKIDKVNTTHPKVGSRQLIKKAAPPTDKIKSILKNLTDIPKKAEIEMHAIEDYKKEVHRLKMELRQLPKVTKSDQLDARQVQREYSKGFKDAEIKYESYFRDIKQQVLSYQRLINKLASGLRNIASSANNLIPQDTKIEIKPMVKPEIKPGLIKIITPKVAEKPYRDVGTHNSEIELGTQEKISGGAMRMLKAASMFYPNEITRARMGAIAGLSYKSGSFNTYLATLKRNDLIQSNGHEYTSTEKGLSIAGDVESLPTDPDSLIDMWARIIKGGASRMLKALCENYPSSLTREELMERAELKSFTSGSFNTYLATLKRNGLITINRNEVKASDELFQ